MARLDTDVVINDAIIASQAANKEDYQKLGQLPFVERTIIRYAAKFIKQVQDNLKKANKVDTGTLSTDIAQADEGRGGDEGRGRWEKVGVREVLNVGEC